MAKEAKKRSENAAQRRKTRASKYELDEEYEDEDYKEPSHADKNYERPATRSRSTRNKRKLPGVDEQPEEKRALMQEVEADVNGEELRKMENEVENDDNIEIEEEEKIDDNGIEGSSSSSTQNRRSCVQSRRNASNEESSASGKTSEEKKEQRKEGGSRELGGQDFEPKEQGEEVEMQNEEDIERSSSTRSKSIDSLRKERKRPENVAQNRNDENTDGGDKEDKDHSNAGRVDDRGKNGFDESRKIKEEASSSKTCTQNLKMREQYRHELLLLLDYALEESIEANVDHLPAHHKSALLNYDLTETEIERWFQERRAQEKEAAASKWPIIEKKAARSFLEKTFQEISEIDEMRIEEMARLLNQSHEEILRWFLNRDHEFHEKRFLKRNRREARQRWDKNQLYPWHKKLAARDLEALYSVLYRECPPVKLEMEILSGNYIDGNVPFDAIETFLRSEREFEERNRDVFTIMRELPDDSQQVEDALDRFHNDVKRYLEETRQLKFSTQKILQYRTNYIRLLPFRRRMQAALEQQQERMFQEIERPAQMMAQFNHVVIPDDEESEIDEEFNDPNGWIDWTVDEVVLWAARFCEKSETEKLRTAKIDGRRLDSFIKEPRVFERIGLSPDTLLKIQIYL